MPLQSDNHFASRETDLLREWKYLGATLGIVTLLLALIPESALARAIWGILLIPLRVEVRSVQDASSTLRVTFRWLA